MNDWVVRRCIVSGRVQGVFYRASARQRAQALGVTGSAVNRADGRVEVLACGAAQAVAQFCDWLWTGSPTSSVTAVEVVELDPASLPGRPSGFTTG